MKASITVFTVFFLLVSVSCGVKKSTRSTMEKTQEKMAAGGTDESRGTMAPEDSAHTETDTSAIETTAEKTEQAKDAKTDSMADNAIDKAKDAGSAELYSKLNMTESQIQMLETGLDTFKNKQRNMANGEMLGTVDDEKQRILEKILSPKQLSTYQTLMRMKN